METTIDYKGLDITIYANDGVKVNAPKSWGSFNGLKQSLVWKYEIEVFIGDGSKLEFDYHCGELVPISSEDDLITALKNYVSDAECYGNNNFEDFISEFGYDENPYAYKIYKACGKAYEEIENASLDVYELSEWLNEKYEEL